MTGKPRRSKHMLTDEALEEIARQGDNPPKGVESDDPAFGLVDAEHPWGCRQFA
jgi:hypothetical protein